MRKTRKKHLKISWNWLNELTKIAEPKTLALVAFIVCTFLLSGGIYVLAERPPALQGGTLIFRGTSMHQGVTEFIAVLFTMIAGETGLLILYSTFKERTIGRALGLKLLMGISLALLAYVLLEFMLKIKIGIF